MQPITRWLALILIAAVVAGCSTLSPLKAAETAEQRAFAAYGTFVVYQELAVDIMRDPQVPDSVKLRIQRAEGQAKPVADSLLDTALEVSSIRRQFDEGRATDSALLVAVQMLDESLERLAPLINNLVAAVRDAT